MVVSNRGMWNVHRLKTVDRTHEESVWLADGLTVLRVEICVDPSTRGVKACPREAKAQNHYCIRTDQMFPLRDVWRLGSAAKALAVISV